MQPPHCQSRWSYTLIVGAAALAGLALSPITNAVLNAPVAGAEPVAAVQSAAPLDAGTAELRLLELTNVDRQQNGLPPLDLDPQTLSIARERAATQLDLPSLSHYDPDGRLAFVQLLAQSGVDYSLAGENLARSSVIDPTVTERVEDALMRSPTHRKNILEGTFTRVSIGAATDDQGRITFAEIFRAE
jgi:uncharacterized protein YkwD